MNSEECKAVIEAINESLENSEAEAILLGAEPEDFAPAILGIIWAPRISVAYLRSKVIQVFVDRDGMTQEDAAEFYEFNTVRSIPYVGEDRNPPTLVDDIVS